MIGWMMCIAVAGAWEEEPLYRHDLPEPLPEEEPSFHGVVDLPDLVIVRPQGTALQSGFHITAFMSAVEAAVAGREGVDFASVMHSDQLPTQFSGAAAFHLTFNNVDERGTGKYHTSTPEVPIKAGLWMSYPSYWDSWPEGADTWVFGQELGHQWLAFAEADDGDGPTDVLLGRGGSHWSWFMDTPQSPMEGNAWIDHGDGTFTTDLEAPYRFSDLDLYLMGFVEQAEVAPMFYIEPDGPVERTAGSAPEWLWAEAPITISGTRVDVTVDEIIAAHGPRLPGATDAQRDFTILPVLVVGPEEIITPDLVERVRARHDAWAVGWTEMTVGLSSVDFAVPDDARQLPPPIEPLVPRGAR